MKKFSIGLLAFLLAIGAAAFATSKNEKRISFYWFSNPTGQTTTPHLYNQAMGHTDAMIPALKCVRQHIEATF